MKTTLKEIKSYPAADISDFSPEQINRLKEGEKFLTQVAYSTGIYGISGIILQGYASGTLYKVTKRSTALFMVL